MDRFSLIGLVNTGATDQSVTLTYSIAGSSTVLNSGPVLIRANGSLRQTVVDLFGPAGTNGDHGVLRVTGANAVRGFLATGSSSGSSIAAAPAQYPVKRILHSGKEHHLWMVCLLAMERPVWMSICS
jgi:hypothetical protein